LDVSSKGEATGGANVICGTGVAIDTSDGCGKSAPADGVLDPLDDLLSACLLLSPG
jgi:hypothetical protein